MHLYCHLLLDTQDITDAQKALNILTDSEIENDPNLNVFKAKALRYLDRLDESAECLAGVCHENDYRHLFEADALLLEITDRIEELQQQTADFPGLIRNSQVIARYCQRIALSTNDLIPVSQSRLYLAELSLFTTPKDPQKLSQIDELLNGLRGDGIENTVSFIRCRAGLLREQGKFEQAARLWAQVAKMRKNQAASNNTRPRQWWRAKFYELDCCAKMPQTKIGTVLHAIEVLENSFPNIPPLWAQKLSSLKQQCRKDDDSAPGL